MWEQPYGVTSLTGHGTRKTYQGGCLCLLCKAANAAYIAELRQHHREGHQPLGARVSGLETRRLIDRMVVEKFRRGEIAQLLGLKRPILELHTDVITVRNQLKVRRLYRLRMLGEGPEQPHV